MSALDAVAAISALGRAVYNAAHEAKANKKRSARLAERVQALAVSLERLKEGNPARLQQLHASGSLERVHATVQACHDHIAIYKSSVLCATATTWRRLSDSGRSCATMCRRSRST
jgi:tRNA U34 5-carboxymethylaminomethyl modifying enzyme MnmG/GidA